MKKVLAFALAAMSFLSANAGNLRATGMTMVEKGGFTLGVGIGTPGYGGVNKAVMPMITVDGQWGLASGFIKSKHFGNNGGVDLGFQYGICGYNLWKEADLKGGVMQNMIVLRSAFHYQFLKPLDTYAGFFGGVDLSSPTGDWDEYSKDHWDHADSMFGMYWGAKWYFNDTFGAGLEFEDDFIKGNAPVVSAKASFKF